LAVVYQLTGQKNKANELNEWLISAMTKDAENGKNDNSIGHYADREMAYTYLRMGEYDKALEHAIAEYNRRPGNIDVNETVAWVYYNKGNYDKALPYLDTAMKTKSKNPVLLTHAGLIYAKVGDKAKAKAIIQQALQNNANISEALKTEATNTLKTL
jgi:tetratricopeptide (TPR) repeat protein